MGKPIDAATERQVRRLLRQGELGLREIAKQAGCAPGTVKRVREGVRVRRRARRHETHFRRVEPYVCPGCTDALGHRVTVCLRPCVACAARRSKAG